MALSTDKAANPINLYGATKLCSDKLHRGEQYRGGHPTLLRGSLRQRGGVEGLRDTVLQEVDREGATELPSTDERMTRFTITLAQGVAFVLKAFQRMQLGELFVPKIPSMRIVDLAEAMAPGLPKKIVGIRPGENYTKSCVLRMTHLIRWSLTIIFVITPPSTSSLLSTIFATPLEEEARIARLRVSFGQQPDLLKP